MGKTLYLECNSGISGDMTVAALLDLGADEKVLIDTLGSMRLEGYELRIGRTKKCGIDACDFDVILHQDDVSEDKKYNNHNGNHEESYNHQHSEHHGDIHSHQHIWNHGDIHSHQHDDNYGDIHNHQHSENHGDTHSHQQGDNHGDTHNHESIEKHTDTHNHHHCEKYGYTHSHQHGENHEDTHNHQHGNYHEDVHNNQHTENHEHSHEHSPAHTHEHSHAHTHEHRNLEDVYEIIDRLDNDEIKDLAKKIFLIVAKAEAMAHGIPIDEVHFHEVGAVDSIVDIVAVAICINNLDITEVIVSPLAEGSGMVRCQHGIIPVPVPAVINIAMMNDLVIKTTNNKGEMITPTGAAIAAALRTKEALPYQYTIKKIGAGAGKKDFATANIVRVMLLEEKIQAPKQDSEEIVWKLESNIDDCTGEALGYTMEKLLEAGAKDVFYTPIYMKKNRPAYLLSVICKESDCTKLEDIIFTHTTTIGIRRIAYERTILDREVIQIKTSFGAAKVKLCKRGENVVCYPEYESVREICEKDKLDFQQVYASIINQYYLQVKGEE